MVQRSYTLWLSHRIMQGKLPRHRRPSFLGTHLLAGAVGVLAGLQHLLSAKERTKRASEPESREQVRSINHTQPTQRRPDYFSIRRTKSELGYVYWVLQGYGEFQCYVLHDTWKEAADEACRRASDACARSLLYAAVPVTA